MKKLTRKAYEFIDYVVGEVFGGSGIEDARICDDGDNPFAFIVSIPIETDERLVVKACNKFFHALELLPKGKNLAMGEFGDYCQLSVAAIPMASAMSPCSIIPPFPNLTRMTQSADSF